MNQQDGLPGRIKRFGVMGMFLLIGSVGGWAQTGASPATQPTDTPTDAMSAAVRELQEQVRELRTAVVELRSEAGQYRAETEQLRRELQSSWNSTAPEASAASAASATGAPNPLGERDRVEDRIEDRIVPAFAFKVELIPLVAIDGIEELVGNIH